MSRRKPKEPIRVYLMPSAAKSDAEIVGFHPVEGLLGRIDRFPGESLAQMLHRATWSIVGGGVVVLHCRHQGEA